MSRAGDPTIVPAIGGVKRQASTPSAHAQADELRRPVRVARCGGDDDEIVRGGQGQANLVPRLRRPSLVAGGDVHGDHVTLVGPDERLGAHHGGSGAAQRREGMLPAARSRLQRPTRAAPRSCRRSTGGDALGARRRVGARRGVAGGRRRRRCIAFTASFRHHEHRAVGGLGGRGGHRRTERTVDRPGLAAVGQVDRDDRLRTHDDRDVPHHDRDREPRDVRRCSEVDLGLPGDGVGRRAGLRRDTRTCRIPLVLLPPAARLGERRPTRGRQRGPTTRNAAAAATEAACTARRTSGRARKARHPTRGGSTPPFRSGAGRA